MNKVIVFTILVAISVALAGCGETISGVGKDASRISKGVKTIFIKNSAD